jgi:hypothetical protein
LDIVCPKTKKYTRETKIILGLPKNIKKYKIKPKSVKNKVKI